MQFVERAVHPHRDGELREVAVLAYLVDDGGDSGSAQLGGSAGHNTTHLLHQDTVVTRTARQTQVLQDGPDLPQSQPVTGEQRKSGGAKRGKEKGKESKKEKEKREKRGKEK